VDENSQLESIICNLAYFYKGSASIDWLELQPIPKLLRLQKEAEKICSKLATSTT
jgi:hypothetical protein